MKSEKLMFLAALLGEALKTVTISHSRLGSLHPNVYRQMVIRRRSAYEQTQHLPVYLYDLEVQDASIGEAILNLLRTELSQFIRDDKVLSASFAILGGLAGGSPIKDILTNLIKEAIVSGPQSAAESFYTSIGRGHLVFQNYHLLTGIKIENEVQILDGISLIPLSNSSADLPAYLPSWFDFGAREFMSKTLLKVDMSVSPVLREPLRGDTPLSGFDDGFQTTVHSTEVEDFNPGRFFQALTLVGEQPIQARIVWRHLRDDEIFDLSLGTGSGYSYSLATSGASTKFSEAQIRQALDLYFKIACIPTDVLYQLEIPIDRWMKSKTQQGYVDKLIDLGIAFESFFLRGISQEVTFRFSLRGSLYLGEDLDERSRLKRELEQFYRYRSRAVHEGTLPDTVKVNGQTVRIRQFIERSQELFKQSLLKAIESRQLPDWSTIELGGEADDNSAQLPPSLPEDTQDS